MKVDDVVINKEYRVQISEQNVIWSPNTPSPVLKKYPTIYDINGEIIIPLLRWESIHRTTFMCYLKSIPGHSFPFSCEFMEEITGETNNVCKCNVWTTGCICGVFDSEQANKGK